MKQLITFLIALLISSTTFSQVNVFHNDEMQCAHLNHVKSQAVFNPNYNWQSDYLFDYDVKFYFLDIEVSPLNTSIAGNTTMHAEALVAVDTFAFELASFHTIDNILINGIEYTNYNRDENNVIVPVTEIPEGETFTTQVFYHGTAPSGGFFSGVSNATSGWDGIKATWTLSEPFAASEWFPVKQDLEDKADSVWVFLTTASDYMAGSQGILTNTVDLGDGNTRYEWKSNYPIDYYLISFSVSDYQEYNTYAHPEEMNGDSILIQNFIYDSPGALNTYKNGIDATAEMIEVFSDKYILYPFKDEKYGHCLTELGGGMEHQTMTTIGGFGFDLVSHELGHMWFGDNVTCETWSDIWINEGFATYSNYLAREFIQGASAAENFIISKQNNAMSSSGSIYIPESEVYPGNEYRIFSGKLSYDKGASIIHTLRHEIQNDDLFFDVLSTFQTDFTGLTATGEDFKNTAEVVTGMDFEKFFDQWYYGKGYPEFSLEWYWDNNLNELHITSTQTTSSMSVSLFDMLLDVQVTLMNGSDTTITIHQTENVNHFAIPLDTEVFNIFKIDPDNWTMEEQGSISVIIDETSSPAYFTIGPNPANDFVNVFFLNETSGNRTITINDISGRQILKTNIANNQEKIYIANFPKGVYTIVSNESPCNNPLNYF
jgi:aminopeptidase N